MVKKANGKWRMCVDFTNLNKAYPKDSYPLPRIDTLIDSTARHQLLSFMDAWVITRSKWKKLIKRRPLLLIARHCSATK